jgi:hypothetical protein
MKIFSEESLNNIKKFLENSYIVIFAIICLSIGAVGWIPLFLIMLPYSLIWFLFTELTSSTIVVRVFLLYELFLFKAETISVILKHIFSDVTSLVNVLF